MKNLLTSLIALLFVSSINAGEPPVAIGFDPPAAVVANNPFDAAVTVMQTRIDATIGGYPTGSGVCIESNDKTSLVLTNNHVVENEQTVWVYHGKDLSKKPYVGTVLNRDKNLDIAVVSVMGKLPVAVMAKEAPPAGRKVVRNGGGSGYQIGTTINQRPEYITPDMHFLVVGKSESGDSGSGYFDEDGYLVAIHCGKHNNNPRGTPIGPVRKWLKEKLNKDFEEGEKPSKPSKPQPKAEPKKTEVEPPVAKTIPAPVVIVHQPQRYILTRMPNGQMVWVAETQCQLPNR